MLQTVNDAVLVAGSNTSPGTCGQVVARLMSNNRSPSDGSPHEDDPFGGGVPGDPEAAEVNPVGHLSVVTVSAALLRSVHAGGQEVVDRSAHRASRQIADRQRHHLSGLKAEAAVQAKMRQRGLRWLPRHGRLDDDAVHILDSAEHAGG